MNAPITITAAERSPIRIRRGVGLGITSFVLSVIAGSWVIILWAVSIGATQIDSTDTAINAFERADELLYSVKNNGRNGYSISAA